MYHFGPGGNSKAFYDSGRKASLEVPQWLSELGLNAYEYQAGRGVRVKETTAKRLGENASEHGISVSVHAPYYINLCTPEREKAEKSKGHILKSLRLGQWMGAGRIVFHPGSLGSLTRSEAFNNAVRVLEELFEKDIPEAGLDNVLLSPETMGKQNQFGNLDEVLSLCNLFDMEPTIDFAHLHALHQGLFEGKKDFLDVFEAVEKKLGLSSVRYLHLHFSPIEFGRYGEIRHKNSLDRSFGPNFEDLARVIKENDLEPTVICESSGRQAEDALLYKSILDNLEN